MAATAKNGSGISNIQLYGYAGGLTTPGNTLEHFGRRWYDPTTGRFTQQDSIQSLADPSRANRYLYASANPILYVDPSGQSSLACGAALFSGIGALLSAVGSTLSFLATPATGGTSLGAGFGFAGAAFGLAGATLGFADACFNGDDS